MMSKLRIVIPENGEVEDILGATDNYYVMGRNYDTGRVIIYSTPPILYEKLTNLYVRLV